MKIALLSLLTLVILCGIYSLYLAYCVHHAIQVSKTLVAKAIPYEQHPSNSKLHILVIGDSTAVGVGAKQSQDSIAGRIGTDYPDADITNISESGIKLAGLYAKIGQAQLNTYDLIVVQLGANDVTGFTPLPRVQETLSSLLKYLSPHTSHIVLLSAGNIGLSPVFKWPLHNYISARTQKVRKIFMEESARNTQVTYIDLFKARKDDEFTTNIQRYYAPDYFHPSSDGYAVWYIQVKNTLESLLPTIN